VQELDKMGIPQQECGLSIDLMWIVYVQADSEKEKLKGNFISEAPFLFLI